MMRDIQTYDTMSGTHEEAVPVVLMRLGIAVLLALLALIAVADMSGGQSQNAHQVSQSFEPQPILAFADVATAYAPANRSAATLSDHP